MVENHAADTYAEFAETNKELLQSLPPPLVALEYYRAGDLYYFDQLVTAADVEPRRPACNNMYDVFINIRDDETEHVRTMKSCADATIVDELAAKHAKLKDRNVHTVNGNGKPKTMSAGP
jgi:ubiquinol oxidase